LTARVIPLVDKEDVGAVEDADPRVTIKLDTHEHRVTEKSIAALAKHPHVFQRGGSLVHVLRDSRPSKVLVRPEGAPYIAEIQLPRVRELLSEQIDFQGFKEGRKGKPSGYVPIHVPEWVVRQVASRKQWEGIRHLEAVSETPLLRADGTVLDVPGYDAQSGVLFEPRREFPSVPACPSRDEAEQAIAVLLDLLVDFPFAQPEHRSAALAGMLTPVARFAFAGPSPLVLITKNVHGAGGSLLADVISTATTGRPMARMSQAGDDDEERKRILAIALAGDRMVLIDNLDRPLGGAALDAALTGVEWRDRILGRSEMVSAPLLACWFATGNNPQVQRDTLRRVLPTRLETAAERPEERSGFRHDPIVPHVEIEHPRLTVAALTVLRGYCAAGRPDMKLKPWGSYEGWSALVRGALVWAGQADPALGRQLLVEGADTERTALGILLEHWHKLDPTGSGITAARLLETLAEGGDGETVRALREALEELAPPQAGKAISAKSVGRRFAALKGRVVQGRALDSKVGGKLGSVWIVREVSNV
jgi:hypothetical protein